MNNRVRKSYYFERDMMERLATVEQLVIQQRKEWGEILSGFDTKNKYEVSDQDGNSLYYAAEVGGSMLLRLILKARRPFTVMVVDSDNRSIIEVRRRFRFYFHEADIVNDDGQLLGRITKRFNLLRRVYSITDASGEAIFQLFGPLLKPWTFYIMQNDVEQGKITKKWSGLGKETFTDADNFGITFLRDWTPSTKALFLGAVFLIDFVHFENKGN